MTQRFEYGFARIKDLLVRTKQAKNGTTLVNDLLLDGRPVEPTKRFWTSLHLRFGFTSNIFRYFRHDEVFQRISEVAPNDRFRWCIEANPDGKDQLLAVTNPNTALVQHEDLLSLLARYETDQVTYSNGVIHSRHTPRVGGSFPIGGDAFQNRYVLDTPIDGFGRPSVYLALLRMVCSNGAIGFTPAFRSELNLGRGEDGAEFALVRVLDGFNNEEGFAAMRQRFESATKSWASVNEVNKLYKLLVRMHQRNEVDGQGRVAVGGDGASELDTASPLLRSYQRLTGDLAQIYGLANPDALSVKRQRTLPTPSKVYDLLNFASEAATHHASSMGNRVLQAFLGELISGEYDLEGTVDQFSDWKDFYVGNEATTSTLASMHRR